MTQDIASIILAAGKGTRMKSPLPKVLHAIVGKTMIRHVLDSVISLGTKEVITVIGPNMEKVQQEITDAFPAAQMVIQDPQLGTGHAVGQATPHLNNFDGIVVVLYADTPFIQRHTLENMVKAISIDNTAVVVLGFTPADPAAYGRLITNNSGELEAIVEYNDATDEEKAVTLCNSGVMAINGPLLNTLIEAIDNDNAKQEYYLTDIVAIARERGLKCRYVEAEETEVMGINSQAERADAEQVAQKKLRQAAMDNGVMMIAPETVFLCDDTKLAEGVVIHPHVVFGKGCSVKKNAEIRSFSHIEGATIGEDAIIGPFARLRPGAEIGPEARVGNFVEIKKATLGQGAKANHLSYLGDAAIGANANIGAGTITCNYDGYKKSNTVIGEEAFIGSNSSLVAPVTIGEGAIVGAGSTVLKDVEANATAINEMPQKNMADKAAAFRTKAKES